MEKISDYVKAHPYLSGVIALVCVVIFVVIVRGGSGGGTVQAVDSGPSDAEISANAAVQAAQINAQAAVSQAQIGAGYQFQSDQLDYEKAMAGIAADREINLRMLDVTLASNQANAAAATAAANAQASVNLASIQAQRDIEAQRSADNASIIAAFTGVQTAGITADRDVDLASIGASRDINLSSINASRDINLAAILSGAATDQAYISASRDVAINDSNNATSVYTSMVTAEQNRLNTLTSYLPSVAKKDRDDVLISLGTGIPWESGGGGGLPAAINASANFANSVAKFI